jgi:hypothetical protein
MTGIQLIIQISSRSEFALYAEIQNSLIIIIIICGILTYIDVVGVIQVQHNVNSS